MNSWNVLGVEKTKDKDIIIKAYRDKLEFVNPEEDSEGFMRLRAAYEEALKYADELEEEDNSPVGIWIKKIGDIYSTYSKRIDEEVWSEVLEDEVCFSLDSKTEARDALLRFLMEHDILPQKVWQLIEDTFDIIEAKEELYELFPKDYIDYGVIYGIESPDVIDFQCFEIDDSKDYETYINLFLSLRRLTRGNDREEINKVIKEIDEFDIVYPYYDIEKACLLIRDSEQEKAIEILLNADKMLPNNMEILYLLGVCHTALDRQEEALVYYNRVLDEFNDDKDMGSKAYCLYQIGKYEEARDMCADILDENPQNYQAENIYNDATLKLIEEYEAKLKENPDDTDFKIELAWCKMQNKEYDEAINLLKNVENAGDKIIRGYNILAHCFAIKEKYELALSFFQKWEKHIRTLEDDGTEKRKKQISRLAYTIYRQGCCYIGLKDTEKVLELIDKAIETDPEDVTFYIGKANLYYDNKEYKKAIDICDIAIKKKPNYGDAYALRCRAFYELEYYRECYDDSVTCISLMPFYLQAYLYKIKVLLIYDEFEEAKKVLDYLKNSGAEFDDIDVIYGQYLLTKDDRTDDDIMEAKGIYNDLVKKYSNPESKKDKAFSLHYVYYLKALWEKDNNADNAVEYLDMSIEEKEDYVPALYLKVRILKDGQRIGPYEAINGYKKVLEINPQHPFINCAIAEIYDELEEYEKALPYHTAQLECRQSQYYYINRGLAYMGLDRFEEARADYRKGLECDPDNPHPYNDIGITYQFENNLEEAEKNYLEGIKRIDNDPTPIIYRNMVTTLNRQGRYDEALKYHDEVYNKFKRPYDICEKAQTLRNARRPKEALKVYLQWDKVLNPKEHSKDSIGIFGGKHKGSGEYLYYVAECYNEIGNEAKAETYYKKAAEKNYEIAYAELAHLYMLQGKYNRAILYLEKLDPQKYDSLYKYVYTAECLNQINRKDEVKDIVEAGLKKLDVDIKAKDIAYRNIRLYILSGLYYELGDYEKGYAIAIEADSRRLCNSCDYSACYESKYRIGQYFEHMKDYNTAMKYYEAAADINKADPQYRKAVERLKKKMNK